MAAATALKSGEVAKRSGLSVKTIRFYCDEGLVHPTGRSEGGYRLFDNDIFAELALIRTIKAGGIEQKIVALRSLYNELHSLLERWDDCGGRKSDGQA